MKNKNYKTMKNRLFSIILFLFISVSAMAQLPQEFIMGKLSYDFGNFSYKNLYPNQKNTAGSLGGYLKHSVVVINDNNYTEVGTDVPIGVIIQLVNGVKNASPLIVTEVNDYTDTKAGTADEGNKLYYRYTNILYLSQSFKVYDNFMVGYHVGGEGMSAAETDAENVLTKKKALNVTYWTVGPVIAYQQDKFRVETKFKFLLGKKVSKANGLSLKADYYLTNNEQSLSLALGVYANQYWFTSTVINNPRKFNVSSIGLSISLLYPSVWNLL